MCAFPLGTQAVHLCVDMQRLFAEATPWHVPWLSRILPQVVALATHCPARTIFTRFIPPPSAQQAEGAWRDYYLAWQQVTQEHLDQRLLELVAPLAALVPPAKVFDKSTYSAFSGGNLAATLKRRGIDTIIVSGGETDVCVLATVLGAIDRGFRIVLPADALCSVRDQTHDALLMLYQERFSIQIETTSTQEVLSRWRRPD